MKKATLGKEARAEKKAKDAAIKAKMQDLLTQALRIQNAQRQRIEHLEAILQAHGIHPNGLVLGGPKKIEIFH